jgi:hypothetical protein
MCRHVWAKNSGSSDGPVLVGRLFSSGLQDSSGVTTTQEAKPQTVTTGLFDIQPGNSLGDSPKVGTGQVAFSSDGVAKLFPPAVSV